MRKNKIYIAFIVIITIGMISLLPILCKNLKYGLDLQGGFEVLYQIEAIDGTKMNKEKINQTYKILSKRIDSLGVSEPEIIVEGNDKVRIKLAGVKNKDEARRQLSTIATLTFRDTEDNLLMTSDVLTSGVAKISQDAAGNPAVSLSVKDKEKFYDVTNKISKSKDQTIVIWLDYNDAKDSFKKESSRCGSVDSNCLSAATVSQGFASDVIIQGNFTDEEVENLTDLISNLKVTPNSDNTYTISATWNQKVYNKLEYAYIFGKDEEQRSPDRIGTETKSATGISIKTKAYKNNKLSKMFYLTVRLSCYRYNITKQITINSEPYSNAINIISKKAGNISRPMSTIVMLQNNYTQLKQLRQHDIIKLSRKMRYIYIDSRGYEDNKSIIDETVEFDIGKITAKINVSYMHLSGPIYQYVIQSLKLKTSNSSTIRIRNGGLILSIEGFTCASINDLQLNGTYQDVDVTQLSGNTFLIDNQSITFTPKVTIKLNPEFDFASTSTTKSLTSKTLSYANSDVVNNHLLEIQVFDNNGNDVSSGKDVKLSDGTNPICPYGTTTKSATNGITNNPNLSIYSNNGLPLVLDLGKEYNISKIKIWRKYNSSNVYFRNYIIGRNNNKELCYIFFDSKVTDGYIETSNGKEFIIK